MIKEEFNYMFQDDKTEYVMDFELVDFTKEVMLENKAEIPSLFRYSSADYYNIRGLETQSLFLTPNGAMNDIFEGLSYEVDDKVLNKLDKINDIAFLKSFSEEKENLLMWAHYADKYSGMCVEYDFKEQTDALLYHLFPVHYSNNRRIKQDLIYMIEEHIDLKKSNDEGFLPNDTYFLRNIMSLFLVKPKCWEYEKEWRIIATYAQIFNPWDDIEDEDGIERKLYDINDRKLSVKNCIKAVHLGPRMKKEIRDHIKEICFEKLGNIPVYETRLSKENYMLEFNKVQGAVVG